MFIHKKGGKNFPNYRCQLALILYACTKMKAGFPHCAATMAALGVSDLHLRGKKNIF